MLEGQPLGHWTRRWYRRAIWLLVGVGTRTTSTAAGAAADTRTDAPDIRLHGLVKRYGELAAVDGIDLDVRRGEFFTFLGPSGSGKTTTLRLIAGFERPDAGSVELRGADVSALPPFDR